MYNLQGKEIRGPVGNQNPILLVSNMKMGDMIFTGTMYVDLEEAQGQNACIGLIFGYQSNQKFYVVEWWRDMQIMPTADSLTYNLKGIIIKVSLLLHRE